MKTASRLTGLALATAAAGLFAMAPADAIAGYGGKAETVKCMGVNACKGMSSCKTATSACKGQNACKGQGFVSVSKRACEQIGGKAEK